LQPGLQAVESLPIRYRVAKKNCVCRPIEDFSDGAEALLAGGVPDLQLEPLVFYFDAKGAELDTDRAVVLRVEPILRQSIQNARFAHS